MCGFAIAGNSQIISQYIDTDSGTTPKGIEIWNNTNATLDFSTNNLVIKKGVNGAAPATDFTLNTGTLVAKAVIVIGKVELQATTEANGAVFYLKNFTFNGDDALEVWYGVSKTDVFGMPGVDPGTAWTGNGVSTADQNIKLKIGITTGNTSGFTDPSTRFKIESLTPSATLGDVDFGIIPFISWTGTTDTNWNTSGNWDVGVPSAGFNAYIPNQANNPIVNTNGMTCKNLKITTGSTLTIAAGKSLTLSDDLTNNGTFIINSDANSSGSLIVSGTSTGNIIYNRYMTGVNKWHLIAAPVGGQSINSFATTGSNNIANSGVNYSVTPYDNTVAKGATGTWSHWTSDGTGAGNISGAGNFTAGKGYEILTTADGTVAFTGTVPTSQVSIAITKPGSANAWNLIGNPFPSSLFANSSADATNNFITVNSAAMDASFQAIYLWNPGTSTYDLINQASATTYIAPGQAFFVKSVSAGATVSFTTAMRTNQSTVAFQKTATPATPAIVLSADNNTGKISTTAIKYIAGKSLGLDPGYDAGLFDATGGNFSLYTKLVADNGVNFMLQVLPDNAYDTTVIPIGLDADAGTQITFKATYSNLPIGKKVFLEDRLIGSFTELNNTDKTYTVTLSTQAQGAGRFYLRTQNNASTLGTADIDKLRFTIVAKARSNTIRVIGNVESTATLNIYDTLGRFIYTTGLKATNDSEVNIPQMAKGIYFIKIKTANSNFSTKIAWY
ncbi:MAG: T9SS type A sorting domain-containing protein [Flavobacteriaceae bacterium]|nr:T9SS type A sorting domain-containing protein [Flavobacteriaceae bacterium]